MRPETRRIPARLLTVLAGLAAAAPAAAAPAAGDIYSWDAGNGWWGSAGNWSPFGTPPALSHVRIGDLPGVQNSTVVMGGGIDSVILNSFEISDGMTLDTNGSELLLNFAQTASITGANTRVIARPDTAGEYLSDFGGELYLGAGAYLELRDNAIVSVGYYGSSLGVISGRGVLRGGILFINDGVIDPDNNGGLRLRGPNAPEPLPLPSVDLDGDYGGGDLLLNTPFSVLEVWAEELTDPFGGTITMVPGALLTMDIDAGWAIDGPGLISVSGNNTPAAASQIAGAPLTFGGTIGVGGAQGHLRVLAEAEIQGPAGILVGEGDHLEFDGPTTVSGGVFDVQQDGQLDFDGPTTLEGGTFSTVSTAPGDGSVDFNGPTVWDGNVTINGVARQAGDATVSGPAAITAGSFHMGGAGVTWNVSNSLVVDAGSIIGFQGTFNIAGGFLGRLTTVNGWANSGTMNLTGDPAIYVTRLDGGTMQFLGDMTVTSGRVNIASTIVFNDPSSLTIGPASAVLRFNGNTYLNAGGVYSGLGTVRNGPTGVMTIDDGASLGGLGLVNEWDLQIGSAFGGPGAGPGVVSVDRFVNTPDGRWRVGIGGEVPGTQHDVLVVDGAATLAGTLQVSLIDAGGGAFVPQVGDQFTILRAGSVAGAFGTLQLPPLPAGRHWQVQYSPGGLPSVVLRVTDGCYPDCNGDDLLTVADFGCFQTKFVGGSPYAECNGDGVLTVADFGCFQTKFVAGCP